MAQLIASWRASLKGIKLETRESYLSYQNATFDCSFLYQTSLDLNFPPFTFRFISSYFGLCPVAMEETWNLMSSQNHLRISTLTCSLVPKLKKAMSYLSLHGLKRMHQCPTLLPVTRLPIEFQCQGAICLL